MALCLLIGNILLIAVAVSYPMYRGASFQRMLCDEFESYMEQTGDWPATFAVSHNRTKGKEGTSYAQLRDYVDQSLNKLNVPIYREIEVLSTTISEITPVIQRDEKVSRKVRLTSVTGLEDYIDVFAGRLPEPGLMDGEYVEVLASDIVADKMDILLDELYEYKKMTWANGEPIRIKVVGIFKETNSADYFWASSLEDMDRDVFLHVDTFHELCVGEENELALGIKKTIYEQMDYEKIEPAHVKALVYNTQQLLNSSGGDLILENAYEGIIDNYSAKAKKVETSLMILQVPVLALLVAFIYMISSQMLTMEQNEISVMKSRGAGRGQILGMYLIQGIILSGIGALIGIPLGKVLCSLIGTATDFMVFAGSQVLEPKYTQDVMIYAAGAVLLTILLTILPVIGYSRVSIVHLKQSKAQKSKSLWKKLFLDFICIGVSLYGYYNFAKNQENMMQQVLMGEPLDPLLYLSSSLFLLGCGLLAVRIQPWILRLIFLIRGNRMSPSSYVSFTDAIRGGKKTEFIMLFMVLTVALGIHSTTVARTIVANAEHNSSYVNGADLVLKEVWRMGMGEDATYIEPDFGRYTVIDQVEGVTKVLKYEAEMVRHNKNMTIMGINTGEFAKIANMPEDLLPYHFYDYLNVLASNEYAVLLSENFMTKLGYKVGDVYEIPVPGSKVRCTIKGFFNYWPSYEPTVYSLNEDGTVVESESFMVVANLAMLQARTATRPYEIWVNVGESTDGVYQFIEENPKLKFMKFQDLDVIYEDLRTDTLFQGTNGILTMSFMIVLVLCGVGYLIYFILSIRSRELLFGVLRAMGMKKTEITRMLILEQIFCGLYAILAGALVGFVGSRLFVPMIQNAYAAENQVLPLELITNQNDLIQLFAAIAVVMVVCLIVIARIVAKMNITKALKLGED
ncbi:MAG: FtsX-like permease family protein [Lachnospiraceae bacterium]|nr:FtsX-like permease family protein [Lachnospiraceae bacterium]